MLQILAGITVAGALLFNNPNEQIADAHYSQRNLQEAIYHYTEAIFDEPENGVLYYKRAKAYLVNNQYEEYHLDITRALELSPDLARILSDEELLIEEEASE